MPEPCMAHTNELPQNAQQVVATLWRNRRRYVLQRLVFTLILTGLCGLMLTGCQDFWDTTADLLRIDGNGEAEAQDQTETRIQTYLITTDGFEIILDNDSDTTVLDSATEFTMRSEGLFWPNDSAYLLERSSGWREKNGL